MSGFRRNVTRFMGAVALSAAMTVAATAQENLLVAQANEKAPAELAALMAPISPYVAENAQNTTSIVQLGTDNYATSTITGSSNLSAIVQGGRNNRAVQAIEGSNSALLLVQGEGSNNNVLQLAQGHKNFQLVAVSGNNNDVAYIQKGNELAGALNVTGSNNSSVFALQTNQSSRYLMPSGLRGLQDKVVVIVPGRMYVFNK